MFNYFRLIMKNIIIIIFLLVSANCILHAQNTGLKSSKIDSNQKSTFQFGEQPERVVFESKKNSSIKKSVEKSETQSLGQSNVTRESRVTFDSPQPNRVGKKKE
jgi:hypothetical protein